MNLSIIHKLFHIYLCLSGDTRVDGDNQEDAEDDGKHCGREIVADGPATNTSWRLEIDKYYKN